MTWAGPVQPSFHKSWASIESSWSQSGPWMHSISENQAFWLPLLLLTWYMGLLMLSPPQEFEDLNQSMEVRKVWKACYFIFLIIIVKMLIAQETHEDVLKVFIIFLKLNSVSNAGGGVFFLPQMVACWIILWNWAYASRESPPHFLYSVVDLTEYFSIGNILEGRDVLH